jgi:hypothetical protein
MTADSAGWDTVTRFRESSGSINCAESADPSLRRKHSLTSEIGDRTFLIAAILSMHHPRGREERHDAEGRQGGGKDGHARVMHREDGGDEKGPVAAAAILFFVFGAKMLREGLEMEGGEAGREKMEEETGRMLPRRAERNDMTPRADRAAAKMVTRG